jgi:uncharacterized damage-inducible protein DinB
MSRVLKNACCELFRETFEGTKPGLHYTWYVEGKKAVLPSVAAIDFEQASRQIPGARATIGAHANHLCYYLHLFNVRNRGVKEASNWEGSWILQKFDEAEWEGVRRRTLAEYEEATSWLRDQSRSDEGIVTEDDAISVLANIAHAAFHLGAIRALIPIVQ